METTKRIVISGYYGFDNAGDDAVLYSIIQALRKEFNNKELEIIVLSNNVDKTSKQYNVKAINRWDIKEIYKAIKQSDLLISGGGSLLQDVTSNKTVPYYLLIIKIAKVLKKEVVFYSQGYGPVNKWHNQKMVQHILNKVEHIFVRDSNSKEELIKIGVKSNIIVSADPVIGMELDKNINVLEKLNISSSKIKIGIYLRPWKNDSILQEKILMLCKELEKKNVELYFIPMHIPEDREFLEKMNLEDVKANKILEDLSLEEIFALTGQLDLVVGMRLHALIMAAAQSVPVVALSYDPKVKAFMESLKQPHCLDVMEFDWVDLLDSILTQINNLEEEKENIKTIRKDLMDKVYMPAKMIRKILD